MAKKGGSGTFTAAEKKTDKSSGMGLSVGLGSVGDIEFKGVVDVDISPLSGDVNYDSSENELGVSGEIGLPGNTVAVGGGVTIDLDSGSISSGSASLGFGGAEVEVSLGCEQTLQVTYWGVGFGISKNTCDDQDQQDQDDISNPPPTPSPKIDTSSIPESGGYVVYAQHDIFTYSKRQEVGKPPQIQQTNFFIQADFPGFYDSENFTDNIFLNSLIKLKTTVVRQTSGIPGLPEFIAKTITNSGFPPSVFSSLASDPGTRLEPGLYSSSRQQNLYGSDSRNIPVYLTYTNNMKRYVNFHIEWANSEGNNGVIERIESIQNIYSGSDTIGVQSGLRYYYWFDFLGYISVESKYFDTSRSKQRRPSILSPEDMSNNQCCDASISLLRKIAKVLAVDLLLEEDVKKKISTETVAAFKQKYSQLAESLPDGQKPKVIFDDFLDIKIYEMAVGGNAKIDDIHSVLRADEILLKGMMIPNQLLVAGGTDYSIPKDYPSILKCFSQMVDLNTIQPFTAVLQDSDPAKKGDQTITKFYPDATSAIKDIIEHLMENKVDSATRLNIQVRQSITNVQAMVAVLETLSIAYTIMNGLGLPYRQKGNTFYAPFDISPDPKPKTENKSPKGFDPKKFNSKDDKKGVDSAIDSLNKNQENVTEKLLPEFLTSVNQEYLHTYFNDEKETLWYYIMSVFMKM